MVGSFCVCYRKKIDMLSRLRKVFSWLGRRNKISPLHETCSSPTTSSSAFPFGHKRLCRPPASQN
ncbi:Hypothetical predicted protein [Podarcis lilfordi]|uniref:Uncharacterized protein n=1 Tax=Podarcis lilfordi TaxID=74358 RepID=A0AA35L0W8_9SAUR|nr:Hypothetical predicted protein [Podarcis lilfordi]